ncbi:MAG: polyprenyl synthetase family protein [Acidobacteria bacterium]|nr:polyprenyl synthetase family protein [Acidobacteriota bacterium]
MTQAATNPEGTLEAAARRVFALIQEELAEVEREFLRQLNSNVQIISRIGEYLHDGGGKRIRPALLLLAARLFDRPVTPSVIRLATVVECLHTATLVHDDIIDGAEVRRGRPSVNQVWGNEVTVLMGDWLYMSAFETAMQERSFEVLDILTSLTRQMTEGELVQLSQIGNVSISVGEYLDIIRWKTAYLFSACAEIGGILGGATPVQQRALREFGLNLGMAFQLIDDVLDFTSSDTVLGKPAGNDLREGKITLPLIYLVQQGKAEDLRMIDTVIREKSYQQVDRVKFVRLLEEQGVLARARSMAQEYAAEARAQLDDLPSSPYKAALLDISQFVIERSK